VDSFEQIVIEEEKPVADEAAVILSRAGFVKRMLPKTYDKAVSAEEQPELPKTVIRTMTDAKLLFFTDKGNCYPVTVEQIPESRPKDRGLALGGLLAGLENGETVVSLLEAGDWSGDLLFVTEGGLVKRTACSEYNVRKAKFAAVNLRDGDQLLSVIDPKDFDSVLLVTEKGMAIHFAMEEVSKIGRTAAGVKGISLANGDRVVHAFVHSNEGEIILISEMGYMKRCLLIDFERQARGGKGVKCMNLLKNGSNGKQIAGALLVTDPYEFHIVQKSGTTMAYNTEDVGIETRSGKGQPYAVVVMGDVVTGLSR
jgi:DNA gyrase/topoisomerase IV subunit A